MNTVAEHEIEHGKKLAQGDVDVIWGWGTAAGLLRSKRRGALIAKAAELESLKQVLEIGCGSGLFTEMFAQSGAHITAVDISPELLEIAKKRGLSATQVEFICSRFEDIQADDQFDAIVGSSVLHHLDVESSLMVIFKLLKKGGKVAFAEPNMLNPQVFAERTFMRKHLSYVSPDETAFIRWQLSKLLSKSGFVNISITPFDWLHPATPERLISTVSKLGKLIEITPLLRELSGSMLIYCEKPVN